eukprot:2805273-Pleurochrysis_carterae.AAC.2
MQWVVKFSRTLGGAKSFAKTFIGTCAYLLLKLHGRPCTALPSEQTTVYRLNLRGGRSTSSSELG